MNRAVGRRHETIEATVRLLFSMTQLVSVPYVVWEDNSSRGGRPLGRYLWDGACIPLLLMLADYVARAPHPLVVMDIAFYTQSLLWIAALIFARSTTDLPPALGE
ncbi:hypothetical protein AURDEDRAFT_158229 [Auricularia subglabra TFB-10046 SS5]|nr:hypothetical protein AURDEDRAFT_158229 [Auricularia subglabra TFB-10046 SS5]